MPFVKGQSGNPGGRVGVPADVRELARAHTAAAIKTLVEVMGSVESPAAARVAAATAVLDRGFGKPAQTITANVRRSIIDYSDDELIAIATGGGEGDLAPPDGSETAH